MLTPLSKLRGEIWGYRHNIIPQRNSVRLFFGLWLLLLLLTLAAFYGLDLMPRGLREVADGLTAFVAGGEREGPEAAKIQKYSRPRIIVPGIDLIGEIVFPKSADIEILNNALSKGVVHYPASALPGQNGNVFLFGHSTGLKVVNNKSYAVFNRLSELKAGDIIRLRYENREYWYKVSSLKTKKVDEAWVDLSPGEARRLTLSTCRIFGAKEKRYVVEAEFVSSYRMMTATSAAGDSS